MSDAIAPVPISDETTRRLFGEPSFRVAKRGGYDPGDVAEFLERLGGQVVTFVGRLRDAESRLEVAETELAHWKGRTRDAEATRETFERTLALAEDTANAAIADARHRAAGMLTKAETDADELVGQARHQSFHMVEQAHEEAQRCYADERLKMREEWQRLQDESAQLETLRLAVAAETMALEEVRNQLRVAHPDGRHRDAEGGREPRLPRPGRGQGHARAPPAGGAPGPGRRGRGHRGHRCRFDHQRRRDHRRRAGRRGDCRPGRATAHLRAGGRRPHRDGAQRLR